MVSLAFRCDSTQLPVNDRDGIFEERDLPPPLCEVQLGLRVLNTASQIIDLDQQLYDNPTLNAAMLEKSTRLLAQARYDAQDYRDWAERNKINPETPQAIA